MLDFVKELFQTALNKYIAVRLFQMCKIHNIDKARTTVHMKLKI